VQYPAAHVDKTKDRSLKPGRPQQKINNKKSTTKEHTIVVTESLT
jgi:hypothetical protein